LATGMINRRNILGFAAGTAASVVARSSIALDIGPKPSIAVIGTGKVGSILGMRWASLGYEIIYGSRRPNDPDVRQVLAKTGGRAQAATVRQAADAVTIIVLAVPWNAVDDVTAAIAPANDKIVVDITNAVKVVNGVFYTPADFTTSGVEHIEGRLPAARVVKAFNTLSVEVMSGAAAISTRISVPLAGEDADAKHEVAILAAAMGLVPLDMGPGYLARYIEGLARLRMSYHALHQPEGVECYFPTHKDA
jgi:predicted dinucleotide-binding enzyme